MNEKWFVSRRIWASILLLVGIVLRFVGFDIQDEKLQELVDPIITAITSITDLVAMALALHSWKRPKK